MRETLSQKNPNCTIYEVTDEAFIPYGKVLDGYDFAKYKKVMEEITIPSEGNVYVLEDEKLMQAPETAQLQSNLYGGMEVQAGYCNGHTHELNALEYHKSAEVDIAFTDLVLLLGRLDQVEDNHLDTATLKAFYVPAGTAVELYGTTLHYAPCALSDEGFKSIVVLPKGTNATLAQRPSPITKEDELLWKKNKWVLAHPEGSAAPKGYYLGLQGENTVIHY